MTNLEKWKNKIAEAKDGYELMETIRELLRKYHNLCFYVDYIRKECDDDCKGCEVMWFDMEAKE